MSIPGIDELLVPFLEILSDTKSHNRNELIETLGNKFGLSNEERLQRDAGNNLVFGNRIDWCRSYFVTAKFIENRDDHSFQITPKGLEALRNDKSNISVKYLMTFRN